MSMTNSSSTKIRKAQTGEPTRNGGEFGSRHNSVPESELAPSGGDYSFDIYDYSGVGTDTVNRYPKNVTEARAALSNVRGEKNGGVRTVFINAAVSPKGKPEVRGPADGRPLLVIVNSGLPRLQVTSGKVIIRSDSGWGNAIEVFGEADVTVLPGRGRKLHVYAEDRSKVTIVPEDGDWGVGVVHSPDASVEIIENGTEHRLEVLHWRP